MKAYKFITDYIDEICKHKYGHTNWAFEHMLTKEKVKELEKAKEIVNIIPTIVMFKRPLQEEE
jgi:hypothetical protein